LEFKQDCLEISGQDQQMTLYRKLPESFEDQNVELTILLSFQPLSICGQVKLQVWTQINSSNPMMGLATTDTFYGIFS